MASVAAFRARNYIKFNARPEHALIIVLEIIVYEIARRFFRLTTYATANWREGLQIIVYSECQHYFKCLYNYQRCKHCTLSSADI